MKVKFDEENKNLKTDESNYHLRKCCIINGINKIIVLFEKYLKEVAIQKLL